VLGVTTISFALAGVVAIGGVAKVAIGAALVVEEKMVLTLLLVLFLFLHLYYSHNRNTRKEK
jgi:uncharacterized membrane protein